MKPSSNSRLFYAILAASLATLVLYNILPYDSDWVEQFYSQGMYVGIRYGIDYLLSWFPIPLIYILLGGIIYVLIFPCVREASLKKKFASFFKRTILILSLLILAFYWLWGFNYKRNDLREVLGIADFEVDTAFLFQEYQRVSDSLSVLRALWPSDVDWREELLNEDELRLELLNSYTAMEMPYAGKVNIRRLRPKGVLLHWSSAGVYLPWVGEGHIDAGLHPITYPFTMTHEMSHGYGWTGEDVCNFLALMACVNSENNYHRYSGYMGYWRYLRNNAYRANSIRWKSIETRVSPLVLQDLKEVHEYSNRYPDIMPRLRNLFYDNYLKSHGVSSGLVSYSEVIKLSHAWQKKNETLQLNGAQTKEDH